MLIRYNLWFVFYCVYKVSKYNLDWDDCDEVI